MKLPSGLGGLAISPDMIRQFLQGLRFPVDKQGLLQFAADKGVPREVLEKFGDLPDRTYSTAADVAKDYSELE